MRRILDEPLQAGTQSITWRGMDDAGHPVPSGVYFIRFQADGCNVTKQILLLR
ncbi:MAG: hypothetical protein KAY32_03295 [Candidatus Eisenbacteria sp.]|nr:hypothetical protein [Candidatus Eisenbacteria bacterium]